MGGLITESFLESDLNELAQAMIRDMAIACKKTAIYGPGHPLSAKAVDKALLSIGQIFCYKRKATINVQKGVLYALNIDLKDTMFNSLLLGYLQQLDIYALEFDHSMKSYDLTVLIDGIVLRSKEYDQGLLLDMALAQKGIRSIEINTKEIADRFEQGRKYAGRFDGDFSVKRLVFDQLGNDLSVLASIFAAADDELLAFGVDFDADVVRYLLPERIAIIDPGSIRKSLMMAEEEIDSDQTDEEIRQDTAKQFFAMLKLVDYHPDRNQIVDSLDCDPRKIPQRFEDEMANHTAGIRIAPAGRIDEIIQDILSTDSHKHRIEDFVDAFHRLLTTGHQEKAITIETGLLDLMDSPDTGARQTALEMLIESLDKHVPNADDSMLAFRVREVTNRIRNRQETFEYSEYIWKLFEKCLHMNKYADLAKLTGEMATRRHMDESVTVYDSIAVKKAFERINQQEVITRLVDRLVEADHEETARLRDILLAIGSEEVATTLASIISHPMRSVRQQLLKIVADLGKASLNVFSGILVNESYFDREPGRHELSDSQWWVVRNSVFVLGLLGDPEGIRSLRLRLTDKDTRVRREIVSALEKIGGEDAIDCLIFMAEDSAKEIRGSAIIAVGVIGTPDAAPLLIDVVRRTKTEVLKIVTALARLGGREARAFLGQLLEEDESLSELASGKVSKEDLRVAVIKALGRIGDHESIEKIREYQASHSSAHRLFFKNSAISTAIAEVLSNH
jgi:HEAT repeat protein